MMRAGLGALLSHWRHRPLQLAMLLLGLALATALWSGVQAINAEARASYAAAAATLSADRLPRLVAQGGGTIPQDRYVALRRAGWPVSPVIEGRLGDLRLIGIEPLTLPRSADPGVLGGGAVDLTAFVTPPGLVLIGQRSDDPALQPQQIADLPPGVAMADIGTVERLLGRPGQISHLLLGPDAPDGAPPGLARETPQGPEDLARLTDSFHLNLTAFGFLAFAVGLFIVHSAIGLAFEQRRPVFRTLRALGLSARALTGLVLVELTGLALLAGGIGVGMGYGIAAVLLPDVAGTLRGLYGADVPGSLAFRPGWWAAGLGIAVAGTWAAAAQGLWQVWRLPILASAQPRAWARARAAMLRWQGGLGLGLLAAGALAPVLLQGLSAGFGLLAGLLLGAALLLPVVLTGLIGLGQRLARGVLGQWFWADARQSLPGLSLALMALLLALATNIGVGTMVSSFRLTFVGWLDQRLASELYVTARDEDQARALVAWVTPRVQAVLPILGVDAPIAGRPGELYGVVDHPTYRDHWPLLSATGDVWDQVAAGDGVLVNEQLARRAGLALGDPLDLPGGALTVVGVYSDYGNPRGQVLVAADLLIRRFPEVSRLRYGLRVAPDQAPALARALQTEFGLADKAIIDQAALKATSLAIFERTFAVTAALNVLTLGVAGLAMFASLMTLSGLRLAQLAPVWALGVTKTRLVALDLARTLVLAALTLVAALPLGLALAWALLAVVNVAAFGWRLPMHLFPGDWLRLGGLALAAIALAALVPARHLMRLAPADLLRVFANER